MGIFLSFSPWIVFWVLSGRESFVIAAAAATVVVFSIIIREIREHSAKVLDIGSLLFFVFLTVVAFTPYSEAIDSNALPLSNVALFLITIVSILIRKPFTLQYAREQVDKKFWDSPGFYSTNLVITWVWCVTFAIIAVVSYMALHHPFMLDRVIHILAFVGAIKFTSWYPHYVKKKRGGVVD
ncbi:MAG: hypothetical protein U9Q38_10080 [Thermodesulfobacteriota bacterium]|nr:hypothetical protein [Thermodesulfobacteriota bacterium]